MALGFSFYGGKSGASYRLVEHFDSVKDMVDAFQKGGSYNKVNYGEYVIIDTIINKNRYNSPENGIIYRRGLNYLENFNPNGIGLNKDNTVTPEDVDASGSKKYYTVTTDKDGNSITTFNKEQYLSDLKGFIINPGGGAEYIGQIVGPQGESTALSFLDWNSFLKEYQSENAGIGEKGSIKAAPTPAASFDENGDVKESEILDVIQYGYVNLLDEDGNIVGAHISIQIPSSVFKYHAESIEPYETGYATYDEATNSWNYANLISEDNISKTHPYYWQYDIKVPKGIKGQDLEQFDIEKTGRLIDENNVDQSDHNYQYYYVTRNYDKNAEGETTKTYIDSYERSIFKITNNGSIPKYNQLERSKAYNLGDRVAANGLANGLCLQCMRSGTTSSTDLVLSKKKENDSIVDGTALWIVVSDQIQEPNLLTIHYTHGDNDEVKIRVLDNIICDDKDGRIYVKYSDLDSLVYIGQNQSILKVDYIDTPWVDGKGVSHTIDRLRITYNTYNYNNNGDIIYDSDYSLDANGNLVYPTTDEDGHNVMFVDEQFKFVDRIETNTNQDVIAYYNDGTSNKLGHFKVVDRIETDENTKIATIYYNDGTSSVLGSLKNIDRIYLENEGNLGKNKYFTAEYNTKDVDGNAETKRLSTNPLSSIVSIQQYGDNIIVLYSDPDVRKKLYKADSDYAIANTAFTIPEYTNTTGDDDGKGNLYWINLGSIYKSNHVFGNFSSLDELKAEYPYGLEKDKNGNLVENQKDHAGWIATVQDADKNISMYAFDYKTSTWYKMQDLSASAVNPAFTLVVDKAADANDTTPSVDANGLLNVGGYWFVVRERED